MVHGRFWEMDIQTKHLKDICSGLHLIPILIQTGDGKYYVSNSTTAERKNKSGTVTYVAISDHLFNKSMYNKVIMAGGGQVYSSLSEAYAAYEKELEKKEYKDYPSDYLQGYCLLRLP